MTERPISPQGFSPTPVPYSARGTEPRCTGLPELFLRWFCKSFHHSLMHPIQGRYRCRKCLRTFPVDWNGSIKPHAIKPKGRVEAKGEAQC